MAYRCAVATTRIWFDWALSAPPARARAAMDAVAPRARADGVSVRPGAVAGVPGCWNEPAGSASRTLLYLHGGGYRIGSSKSHLSITCSIAGGGCRVFSADYRMAPEQPFPAALEDAIAAYRGLLALGAAPGRLFVAGDSAGGGLAVALLVALREQGLPLPCSRPGST
jgi:monoterpene epsilon-lactone hydrolase